MKLIRSTTPLLKQFRPTAITLAVCALMTVSVMTHSGTSYDVVGNASYNKLGDLTIYQPSTESNKPTLTLMLDKSGSMGGGYSFQDDEPGYGIKNMFRAYTCNDWYCDSRTNYYYLDRQDIPSNQTYDRNVRFYTVDGLKGKYKICQLLPFVAFTTV